MQFSHTGNNGFLGLFIDIGAKGWILLDETTESFCHSGPGLGVLGLNGAGKSTLLRIIAGLDDDYLGTIDQKKGVTFGSNLVTTPQLLSTI